MVQEAGAEKPGHVGNDLDARSALPGCMSPPDPTAILFARFSPDEAAGIPSGNSLPMTEACLVHSRGAERLPSG